MREHVAATSLHYLSLDGMQWATGIPEEDVCRACFTRSYPTGPVRRPRGEAPVRGASWHAAGCRIEAHARDRALELREGAGRHPSGHGSRDALAGAVDYARTVPPDDQTYAAAGVSLATAEAVVDRLRAAVESTRTPAVVGSFGAFAGLYAIDERRLLAASTDSVGSKLVLARRAGRLRWCGADLAAHGINDVLTTGAEPLFFLDYVAANTIDPEQVAELVEGAADVCRAAGCAILGGETAELPGVYRDEELDFCGTVVGLVDRDDVIDGSRARTATSSSGCPPRESTQTASRSCGASSATTRSTPTCCCPPPAATSTTSVRSAPAPTSGRWPT